MATLIKIGNSQGLRIPKTIIDQAQLEDRELEFKVTNEGLLIHPKKKPREGWAEKFEKKPAENLNSEEQEWLDASLTEDGKIEW